MPEPKMVSLKMDKKAQKNQPAATALGEAPEYSYGTRIRLESDELKKLGIKELPKVGSVLHIDADVIVASVSENQTTGGAYRCCELQITDMGISSADEEKKDDVAGKMYDKGA